MLDFKLAVNGLARLAIQTISDVIDRPLVALVGGLDDFDCDVIKAGDEIAARLRERAAQRVEPHAGFGCVFISKRGASHDSAFLAPRDCGVGFANGPALVAGFGENRIGDV